MNLPEGSKVLVEAVVRSHHPASDTSPESYVIEILDGEEEWVRGPLAWVTSTALRAAPDATSGPSITCPICAMTSYNPNDIREGYCGNCHDWTSAPAEARQ